MWPSTALPVSDSSSLPVCFTLKMIPLTLMALLKVKRKCLLIWEELPGVQMSPQLLLHRVLPARPYTHAGLHTGGCLKLE